ncbi:S8 family peptidase [Desulfovibrio sp. TomC]|uniref:S8 family peptidase n=1 Tax=Desulfovibrio sp. TomC TaxID=1562888 RepID=UPI000574854C|nr:S8 family serine peptidase [Desulfovibrio sp. TomC]KHK03307.1 Subtilase domain protein [Desulfovibrio sp. TomC]
MLKLSKRIIALATIHIVFIFSVQASAQQSAQQIVAQIQTDSKLHASQTALAPLAAEGAAGSFIVMLKQTRGHSPSEFTTEAGKAEVRAKTQASLDAFFNRRQAADLGTVTRQFSYMPAFVVTATAGQLAALLANDAVASVEENGVLEPHLRQGIPLENALATRSRYNGSGVSVAVCDTGIDYTNLYLGNGSFPNAKVLGGYDTGEGKADPLDRQGHGTACAGIVAGDLADTGDYIGGVAPGAKLYALKISSTATGGSASNASMIAAWEWAVTHQNDSPANPIRIISTSFGGGQYTANCDAVVPAMTTAAANAVAAGITLFASSGNDGYCTAMGWPACISHVVSVGAVYDANFGNYTPCVSGESCANRLSTTGCTTGWYVNDPTAADKVTAYSNSTSFLTLFAPSNQAYTLQCAYQGGTFNTSFGGTSAACPYAAGAAAALQSAAKAITGNYLTPAQVRSTLTTTGTLVTDGKTPVTKPRVNLKAAIGTLKPPPVAGVNLLPLGLPASIGIASTSSPTSFTELFTAGLGNWTANTFGLWSTLNGATTIGTGSAKYHYLHRSNANFANLDYRVTMQLSGNAASLDAACLFMRSVPTPQDTTGDLYSGYWMAYRNGGTYSIWKVSGYSWAKLQDWTSSTAINQSGVNELRAVANGTTLTFYINGIQVLTTTDATHTSGKVGFGLYDAQGGALNVTRATLTGTAADPAFTVPADAPPAAGSTTDPKTARP